MKQKRSGKLYGIGIGPGDPKLLTLKAVEILERVDVIFCPKGDEERTSLAQKIVETAISAPKEFVELLYPMTRDQKTLKAYWHKAAKKVAETIEEGREGAFITIGDPLLYSTYIYLLETLRQDFPDIEVETIPGISAFNAASAKVQIPLAQGDERVALLPVQKDLEGIREALETFDTVVLMKVGAKLKRVMALLADLDLLSHSVLVSRLGQPGEKVVDPLKSLKNVEREGYLSVIIVRTRKELS